MNSLSLGLEGDPGKLRETRVSSLILNTRFSFRFNRDYFFFFFRISDFASPLFFRFLHQRRLLSLSLSLSFSLFVYVCIPPLVQRDRRDGIFREDRWKNRDEDDQKEGEGERRGFGRIVRSMIRTIFVTLVNRARGGSKARG